MSFSDDIDRFALQRGARSGVSRVLHGLRDWVRFGIINGFRSSTGTVYGARPAHGSDGAPAKASPHKHLFDGSKQGRISLVGAGPGARDLLTLRAVERIQTADVIFYDRLIKPDVLTLAHKETELVFAGKHVGNHTWPQEKICAAIVAEALKGRKVVRLKSGDPGVFGRATEELDAARAAGIPIELVPGVTAASAAAASIGQSLTQRTVSDTLVLATGTGCRENHDPNSARHSGPGTTTAFYMSVRQAGRLSAQLIERGLDADTVVDICVDVSKPTEKHVSAAVCDLESVIKSHGIKGCTIILVTWPVDAAIEKQERILETVPA